jgi:hypothetical protein
MGSRDAPESGTGAVIIGELPITTNEVLESITIEQLEKAKKVILIDKIGKITVSFTLNHRQAPDEQETWSSHFVYDGHDICESGVKSPDLLYRAKSFRNML